MNWAVIAREERLFKGNILFKWDQSPGLGKNMSKPASMRSPNFDLEHHCGICATPLHSKPPKHPFPPARSN